MNTPTHNKNSVLLRTLGWMRILRSIQAGNHKFQQLVELNKMSYVRVWYTLQSMEAGGLVVLSARKVKPRTATLTPRGEKVATLSTQLSALLDRGVAPAKARKKAPVTELVAEKSTTATTPTPPRSMPQLQGADKTIQRNALTAMRHALIREHDKKQMSDEAFAAKVKVIEDELRTLGQ